MEAVVDIVGNEGPGVEDCISSQEAADPVVYQLARVDGNGVLVPATDDEVLAVEDLLEDCKSKAVTSDTGETLTSTDYGCGPGDSNSVGSEGHRQLKVLEGYAEEQNVPPDDQAMDQDEKKISSAVSSPSEKGVCQAGSLESCSKLSDRLDDSQTSSASVDPGLKPDFSLLNGEIHLECLSVRDLQETFRATFGRETSVKDKQWLKRRIIMGLTNSCDFSITSFIVVDNKVVKKGKYQVCKNVDCSVLVDGVSTPATKSHQSPVVLDDNPVEIHSITNETNLQSSNVQDTNGSQEASMEQPPAKRIRKPTKRYIEELSDGEQRDSAAKFVSSFKQPSLDQSLARDCARPAHNIRLDGKCFTRKDSLGGSGIQVPYVSRIRRSRPRGNFASLMKLHLGDIGISTRREKNHVTTGVLLENESGNEVLRNSLSPRYTQEPTGTSLDKCSLTGALQLEKEAKKLDSHNSDDADDEVVNAPNSNGGMRRKHHRPWTLTEVVKLVEGVAEYGAGRWSDIKRLAFASYSYRTSVDLKDKWRNLLRASLSESTTGNGIHGSRKQVSIPIPASILSRVRELANIHTPTLKLGGHLDSKVAQSGGIL